jgi:hypothetical protein
MSTNATSPQTPSAESGTPVVIPAVELRGPLIERLRTLDATIVRLQSLRQTLAREPVPGLPNNEFYGRHVNAPVWPWFTAGCVIGALFVLFFVIAWSYS